MTPAKLPRKYDQGLVPSVFRVAPKACTELTEAQKRAIATRMAKALQNAEASKGDAKADGSEGDR